MDKTRILVADDHAMVRRGIRALIESEDGLEVCGEAITGPDAVKKAEQLHPDVVVLDVAMPELGGVEVARRIKQERAATEILAFTGHESEALVHQLFAAGARACVLADREPARPRRRDDLDVEVEAVAEAGERDLA